jgi:ribonuclease P/MRP protein subunit RPP40
MNDSNLELEASESERDLGLQVQPNLKWKLQTQLSVNKASRALGLLKNTFESRQVKLWSKLYTTYVRPHLEYAIQAWNPPNVSEILLLERVHRRATKVPISNRNLSYEERLDKMSLTTFELRRKRGDLIQFYKYMNNIDALKLHHKPVEASDEASEVPAVRTRGNSRRVRSQSFSSREINDYRSAVSARMNFFTNRTIGWWNILPESVISAKKLNAFKAKLDDWLKMNSKRLI